MKKVLPIAILALFGTACSSVEPSADPYYHDGVYSLHDGGDLFAENDQVEESDSSYYDEYVIDYIPGEASISPHQTHQPVMGYPSGYFYNNSLYNDTYWNSGYGSSFYSPYYSMSPNYYCGMGFNWNLLFGFTFQPYYYPYYYPYGMYPTFVYWEPFHQPYHAPRTHQLYGYALPENGAGSGSTRADYGRLRTITIEQDHDQVWRNDRGFGAWLERMAEAPSGAQERQSGFQNFVRDVSKGLERMAAPDYNTGERPSTGGKSGSSGTGRSGSGRSGSGSTGRSGSSGSGKR